MNYSAKGATGGIPPLCRLGPSWSLKQKEVVKSKGKGKNKGPKNSFTPPQKRGRQNPGDLGGVTMPDQRHRTPETAFVEEKEKGKHFTRGKRTGQEVNGFLYHDPDAERTDRAQSQRTSCSHSRRREVGEETGGKTSCSRHHSFQDTARDLPTTEKKNIYLAGAVERGGGGKGA